MCARGINKTHPLSLGKGAFRGSLNSAERPRSAFPIEAPPECFGFFPPPELT